MSNLASFAFLVIVFAIIWAIDRKNFKREGILLLRRTTRGLQAIDAFAKKHAKPLEKYADAGIVASFGLLGVKYLAKHKGYSRGAWAKAGLKYGIIALIAVIFLPQLFAGIILAFNVPEAFAIPLLYIFMAFSFVFGLAGYSFFMLAVAGIASTLSIFAGSVPPSALKLVLPFSLPAKYAYLPVQSVPIIPWIVSIFVILVAHEFSHAIIARREGIRVKSMGYGFMAILPLGFAEPDEKQIERAPSLKKTRIFAAGSWSNIISGILILLISLPIVAGLSAMQDKYTLQAGLGYDRIDSNITAQILPPQGVITEINGINIHNYTDYQGAMARVSPGDAVRVVVDGTPYNFFAQADSKNESRAILGFSSADLYVKMELRPGVKGTAADYALLTLNSITTILSYIVILSIGIALANLLPIRPLDGGLMFIEAARVISPKRPEQLAKAVSSIALALLLYTLFGPTILRGLL